MQPPWNPVHRNDEDNQWYFWDEAQCHRIGPYPSEAVAKTQCRIYFDRINQDYSIQMKEGRI